MVRAILFANATATTLNGRRSISAPIHWGNLKPRLPSLRIDVAPTINSVLKCRFPRFDMEPMRSFPPLECARGVNPIQAAKFRPVRNPSGFCTAALTVAAIMADAWNTGQTPCIFISFYGGDDLPIQSFYSGIEPLYLFGHFYKSAPCNVRYPLYAPVAAMGLLYAILNVARRLLCCPIASRQRPKLSFPISRRSPSSCATDVATTLWPPQRHCREPPR
jgi:hypothetical protein